MVATQCMTYNHAPYIEDALRGFAMQETTFPVVYIVVDDASTDSEPEVLQKWVGENLEIEDGAGVWEEMPYGQLSVAPLKGKPLSLFVILLLNENHYSTRKSKMPYIAEWNENAKYIAMCEGDDYWIDPYKLQKQVDFMEAHPEYGMCHTDFDLSDGSRRKHYKEIYYDGNYYPGNIEHEKGGIGTLTVLFRKETFDKTPKYYLQEQFVAGDKPRWYELSKEAKIKYLPEVTACYRVLPTSASHSSSLEKMLQFREGLQHIRKYYANKYGIKLTDFKNYYTGCLRVCYQFGEAEKAKKFIALARENRSVTMRGFFFFLGARYNLIKKIVELVGTRPK